MNNKFYADLKRDVTAAYQKNTERLHDLNKIPPEKVTPEIQAQKDELKARLACVNRNSQVRAKEGEPQDAGLLRSMHDLCKSPRSGYIIPSMNSVGRAVE